jgi:hypothetical protein
MKPIEYEQKMGKREAELKLKEINTLLTEPKQSNYSEFPDSSN